MGSCVAGGAYLPIMSDEALIVDKTGSVINVKVVRGVDKNLDAEAVRVIKSLPKYKPGKQRGQAVRVMFTIPINFTLN